MLVLSALSAWYLPRLGLRLVVLVGLLLVAAGFLSMRVLDVGSPYWDLAWPLLILSTGIGLCTAPTTSAIMTSVPDDKQGGASAVNDTTREVGAALGIALTGSIPASQYTAAITPHLTGFPEPVRGAAARSLGEAIGVAERLGRQGPTLIDVGRAAFVDGMHTSVLVLGIVLAVSAVLITLWAPGRDGRQLAVVRRWAGRPASALPDELGGAVGHHDGGRVRTPARHRR
jgi:Major Facilitator Superfamily